MEKCSPEKVTSLTRGGIQKIYEMENKDEERNEEKIYLQVLQLRMYEESEKNKSVKQKFILSDGISSSIVFLDRKRYNKNKGNSSMIKVHDIVYIKRVAKKLNATKPYLFCLDVPILVYTGLRRKIGRPHDYSNNLKSNSLENDKIDISIPEEILSKYDQMEDAQTDDHFEVPSLPSGALNDQNSFMPIKALNSFVPEWKIKAKVNMKGEIKRWNNARGEGYLLNINLIDFKGDMIQATFFKEAVDKFEPILEEGSVYTFSNGSIKNANKKFSTIPNDFCINFGTEAEIERVEDDGSISSPQVSYTPISTIQAIESGSCINVIGVILEYSDLETIRLRSGGEKSKRMIEIADNSDNHEGCSIKICYWGEKSRKLNIQVGDIVSFTSLKISDYNGKSLNTSSDTTTTTNPISKETKSLKKWYGEIQEKANFKSLTESRSDFDKRSSQNVRTIAEIKNLVEMAPQYGMDISSNFYVINGYVSYIKADEKATYLGCPDCYRKVYQDYEGHFYCEKCAKSLEKGGQYIYMLTARISDATDSLFVNLYRDNANPIMGGMTADEYSRFREDNLTKVDEKIDQRTLALFKDKITSNYFKHHSILIRIKPEEHNNEIRFKYAGTTSIKGNNPSSNDNKYIQFSFKKDNQNLLDRLECYSNKPDCCLYY
ncbi:unnamed protein product [Moneuplotes crassus]|uniref:Replication protein A subunit n=1 Tax=Euplotes crassus TaxID=5936 RepID=A0AAD1TZ60_EUPCR|nr:unnamed protein product [Moneuplotes crassus]